MQPAKQEGVNCRTLQEVEGRSTSTHALNDNPCGFLPDPVQFVIVFTADLLQYRWICVENLLLLRINYIVSSRVTGPLGKALSSGRANDYS
jgi:hypothetical protein